MTKSFEGVDIVWAASMRPRLIAVDDSWQAAMPLANVKLQ